MAPTEAQRFELQQELIGVLKKGPAKTLMESLPPMDWQELATKTDLAALEGRADIRREALRTELGAKIDTGLTDLNAKIDTGLTDLNAKIETGLTDLSAKIDTGLTDLSAKIDTGLADVRGEMKSGLAKQTYVMLAGVAALVTPIYLALFALFAGLGT